MSTNFYELESEAQFDELTNTQGRTVVLNFWASWAPPCAHLNEVFKSLSKKFSGLTFISIEAENFGDIGENFGINSVPTFIFAKNKKILNKIEGADPSQLTLLTEKYSKAVAPASTYTLPLTPKLDTNARIEQILKADPILLFMKGSPTQPKCGFSRQFVSIMGDHDIKYAHFDILEDEEIRQGLKKYSNWPTYPQLYVNGELIGGLDIIKELVSSGEFRSVFP